MAAFGVITEESASRSNKPCQLVAVRHHHPHHQLLVRNLVEKVVPMGAESIVRSS
jgi:hypothetical protein